MSEIDLIVAQVSNAVIKRCCDFIALGEVFDGNVQEAAKAIQASIVACEAWKNTYELRKEMSQAFEIMPVRERAACLCR